MGEDPSVMACYDVKQRINLNKHFRSITVLCLFAAASVASAEVRPFLFTFTPPTTLEQRGSIHFDAGWGNGSLGFSEDPFIDQRLGAVGRLSSRLILFGNVGFGKNTDSKSIFSGQAQAFYEFRDKTKNRFGMGAGGGIRWERDGSNVALAILAGGWQVDAWRFDGNIIFEKANSPNRDPIDLIISMGWLHRLSKIMSIGFEVVGQDLEGFWEPNEAEGGARILVGPAIHFASGRWEGGLTGGYVLRPTISNRTSPADRSFGSNKVLLQISLGRTF